MKENSIEEDIKILNKFYEYEDSIVLIDDVLYEYQNAIKNILSDRDRLQKENEKLTEIKRVASEFINRKPEQFSIGEFRNKLNYIAELNNEAEIALNNRIIDLETKIEKKDKIIDKMAEYLASIDFEEHCVEVPDTCIGCPKEDDLDGYMQCIKQYFENKAKGENN